MKKISVVLEDNTFDKETHYVNNENKNYAVIYRKNGNKKTLKCPFCDEKHEHGIGTGHRISHCKNKVEITMNDGVVLSNSDGYIIIDISY